VAAPPCAHLSGWVCRAVVSYQGSCKKNGDLPLENTRLPQEQPTRCAPTADRLAQGGAVTRQPASQAKRYRCSWRVVPAICRKPVTKRQVITGTTHQVRPLCRNNQTGEYTEGLPRQPREEPASQAESLPLFLAVCAGHLPQKRSEPPGYHRNNLPGTTTLREQPDRQAHGGPSFALRLASRILTAVSGGIERNLPPYR
jgi:hypothetical protein